MSDEDEKRPRRGPDYESEQFPVAKKIADLYQADAAVAACHGAFPRNTADTLHQLSGVPMRSVTRWLKGEQRIPPTLLAKIKDQRSHSRAFVADLEALLERHAAEGALRETLRQAMIVEVGKDFFKIDEEI